MLSPRFVILGVLAVLLLGGFSAAVGLRKILKQRAEILRHQDRIRNLNAELEEIKARLPGTDFLIRIAPPKRSENSRQMFLGRILLASDLPDLSQSPYPNALRLLKVEPESFIHGRPSTGTIRVAAWALSDRKRMPAADYQVGESRFFDVTPLDAAGESARRVQRFDDLPVEASPLFVETIVSQKRLAFRENPGGDSLSRSHHPRLYPKPAPEHFAIYQSSLLPLIGRLPVGGIRSYLQAEDLLQPAVSNVNAAASVVALANRIESGGVRFLYATIPSRWEITVSDLISALPPGFPAIPPRHELLHYLSQARIEVLDFTSSLRSAHAASGPRGRPVVPPEEDQDPHLAPLASEIIAEAIWLRIGDQLKDGNLSRCDLDPSYQVRESTSRGDGAHFLIRQVTDPQGAPYSPPQAARVLLCGDSNVYWWQTERADGAGISAHLARLLGEPVAEISRANFRPHEMSEFLDHAMNADCVIFLQSAWVLWNRSAPHQLLAPN